MGKYIVKRYTSDYFNGKTYNIKTAEGRNRLIALINEDFKELSVQIGYLMVNRSLYGGQDSTCDNRFPNTSIFVDIVASETDDGYILAFPIFREASGIEYKVGYGSDTDYRRCTVIISTSKTNLDVVLDRNPNQFRFELHYNDGRVTNTYDYAKYYSFVPVVHPKFGIFPGLVNVPFRMNSNNQDGIPSSSVIPYDGKKYYIACGEYTLKDGYDYDITYRSGSCILYCTESFNTTPIN